ncbi:MAG: DUF937 domain-containing protein [Betaproteobacteria bacterium]|jgi:uncharacterized protein YidB (DUF937 family)|nr:DUF937 domain-containing protein [Betaproteobacteria bacterium]MBK6601244.1 DUF937 domain-containing protein [Betaproteobacteria bacterium]MBK7079488.1 DUF937 domain-containing protein [Betaproteobacteria bacterium]MBK7592488.1 DUF937 domain-containing protein [Betaproteobacteria bacterium]MBK7743093.1 DUF937 domain-containing protein [Betaproteobacteria bacterium]
MGLLDGLLGNVLGGMMGGGGGAQPQQSPLLQLALQMLQQNGGIEGILGKFQQAGYAEQAQSWVSTGENQPISADALQQVLGQGQLGQLAQQLGIGQGEAAGGLASVLPQLIDQMTPQGQVPQGSGDLVAQALAILNQSKTG